MGNFAILGKTSLGINPGKDLGDGKKLLGPDDIHWVPELNICELCSYLAKEKKKNKTKPKTVHLYLSELGL